MLMLHKACAALNALSGLKYKLSCLFILNAPIALVSL